MLKFIKTLFLVLVMGASLYGGNGVTRQTYTSRDGTIIGRSYTNNNGQTRYYAPDGSRTGYSYQYGTYTRYYNSHNQYLGDVLSRKNNTNLIRLYRKSR